jgi:protein-tyrosine phosphatase
MDDGAHTLQESVAMVRMAAEHGTTDLVCTPHANLTYRFEPELIRDRLAEVAEAAGTAVRLHSGCDFHLSYDNIQDAIEHPQKYTINHRHYLLVEFSDLLIFRNTPEIFSRLQDAGMIPVITHPERNSLLRQRVTQIEAWVASGARVQITAQSLLGDFGRRAKAFSEVLLGRGLAHFVASDAHDCFRRPPRLDLARDWIAKRYGEATAEALCVANPRDALIGKALDVPSVEIPPAAPKGYQIWR